MYGGGVLIEGDGAEFISWPPGLGGVLIPLYCLNNFQILYTLYKYNFKFLHMLRMCAADVPNLNSLANFIAELQMFR